MDGVGVENVACALPAASHGNKIEFAEQAFALQTRRRSSSGYPTVRSPVYGVPTHRILRC